MDSRPGALEDLVIEKEFWLGKRVFLTGHTGFKGAWMSLLLRSLGAEVHGYALPPEDDEGIFVVAHVMDDVHHCIGDIRNLDFLRAALKEAQPYVVIHMAAQSIVRRSYAAPIETYATNVMGTVNLLEAVRHVPTIAAVVVVTSDKCYMNVGWPWGYRESDSLGGHDPYSNSKACAELVTAGYRSSFFHAIGATRIATVRAGNVIGGGDWAQDRLVPDAMRAFFADEALHIRNPQSVRPWQHVLDPILGYLMLARRLAEGEPEFADSWNFGPNIAGERTVRDVADTIVRLWSGSARWVKDGGDHPHEASYLKLDCSKAHAKLGWHSLIDFEQALQLTVEWYGGLKKRDDMRAMTLSQIARVAGSRVAEPSNV
jgi:CDP-glucose 4,6-dehydratase